ncbi:MAG: hypothetical protein BGO13_00780 [Burkholderiales bacterium 66-5]|uniref:DUF748 domain-containing protein n=1 Tax=Comamonas badia TaxID=265291 RepID=UPI00041ED922|nr:DUF748 domain-containing protein [Comamonas badia]OJU89790.1 MAG: hypothetical protein BGO13_00780 [Burkholderiales bacterium 66-5]
MGWVAAHRVAFKRLAWAAAVVVVLYLLAWLALPQVVRSQLQKQGSQALGRHVTVAGVQFNPLTLELTIEGLAVADAAGQSPQLQVQRIYANAAVQSLWRLAPVVDDLQVDAPVLHVARTGPEAFDFDDILHRLGQQEAVPSDQPARFALYNVRLRDGKVDFEDRAVGGRHKLERLTLSLPFLSNLPADRQIKVSPRLAFELDGSAFDSSAEATPFAESRTTQARLQIKDFDLAPLAAYVPASLGVRLQSAALSADLQLDFSEQDATPKVTLGGLLQLDKLAIADGAGQPLLALDGLTVSIADVRPLHRELHLAAVELHKPVLYLRRDAAGALALPGAGQPGDAKVAQADSPSAHWAVSVQKVQLSDGAVHWQDDSLPGAAKAARWQAGGWQAEATDIVWPLTQPLHFTTRFELSEASAQGEAARFEAEGEATRSGAKVELSVNDLSLGLAAPYLAQTLAPALAGTAQGQATLVRDGDALSLKVRQLAVSGLSLSCVQRKDCPNLRAAGMRGIPAQAQLSVRALEVHDADVDLQKHSVALRQVLLQQPLALAERDKAGSWMFEHWLQSPAAGVAESTEKSAEWSVALGELQMKDAAVALRDAAARSPVALDATALDVTVRDLAWKDGRLPAFGLRVRSRVGTGKADPGSLVWDGSAALSPALQVKGSVRAVNLPLQVVQAYLPQELNVDVLRADGSFNGNVHLHEQQAGLALQVQGDAELSEVQVQLKPEALALTDSGGPVSQGADLLRWNALVLRGLALDIEPGQPLALDVRETALTDFFARVIVRENGRINLQDIGTVPAAGAQEVLQSAAEDSGPSPRIRFGPVALTNGTVDFTDHFIKPNYSANLTELTGSLSAFASGEATPGAAPQMAQLELKGRAQGTATLEINGELNPLAKPLALDIQGHMRDLELPPLSPYSVKYAGHGIERGKLSVDVAYKVLPDGQLTANNKLVLKQLAFGDEVKGAPASLPVRLAVALLADRNGVIDVDLPISGSLNDPDFSLGPVILKVIGNLIMKAITAPFSLLASAFGGGDEQGAVAFAAGSSQLNAQSREQLEKIAQALADRPALKATVIGWALPRQEKDGWKEQQLQAMLLAEKRREAVQEGKDAAAIAQVSAEEYPALLKRVYQRAGNIKKPRNLIGMAKDLPQVEMEKLLLDSIAVPDDAMQALALARSVAVRDYLAEHKVPVDRLFIGASKLQQPGEKDQPSAPQVQLQLSAS